MYMKIKFVYLLLMCASCSVISISVSAKSDSNLDTGITITNKLKVPVKFSIYGSFFGVDSHLLSSQGVLLSAGKTTTYELVKKYTNDDGKVYGPLNSIQIKFSYIDAPTEKNEALNGLKAVVSREIRQSQILLRSNELPTSPKASIGQVGGTPAVSAVALCVGAAIHPRDKSRGILATENKHCEMASDSDFRLHPTYTIDLGGNQQQWFCD
jgi:hypothetical protein